MDSVPDEIQVVATEAMSPTLTPVVQPSPMETEHVAIPTKTDGTQMKHFKVVSHEIISNDGDVDFDKSVISEKVVQAAIMAALQHTGKINPGTKSESPSNEIYTTLITHEKPVKPKKPVVSKNVIKAESPPTINVPTKVIQTKIPPPPIKVLKTVVPSQVPIKIIEEVLPPPDHAPTNVIKDVLPEFVPQKIEQIAQVKTIVNSQHAILDTQRPSDHVDLEFVPQKVEPVTEVKNIVDSLSGITGTHEPSYHVDLEKKSEMNLLTLPPDIEAAVVGPHQHKISLEKSVLEVPSDILEVPKNSIMQIPLNILGQQHTIPLSMDLSRFSRPVRKPVLTNTVEPVPAKPIEINKVVRPIKNTQAVKAIIKSNIPPAVKKNVKTIEHTFHVKRIPRVRPQSTARFQPRPIVRQQPSRSSRPPVRHSRPSTPSRPSRQQRPRSRIQVQGRGRVIPMQPSSRPSSTRTGSRATSSFLPSPMFRSPIPSRFGVQPRLVRRTQHFQVVRRPRTHTNTDASITTSSAAARSTSTSSITAPSFSRSAGRAQSSAGGRASTPAVRAPSPRQPDHFNTIHPPVIRRPSIRAHNRRENFRGRTRSRFVNRRRDFRGSRRSMGMAFDRQSPTVRNIQRSNSIVVPPMFAENRQMRRTSSFGGELSNPRWPSFFLNSMM